MHGLVQRGGNIVRSALRHDKHESYAHVEGAPHFRIGNIAGFLQPGKQFGPRPRAAVNFEPEVVGHDAHNVLCQAAAGDVGHAANVMAAQQFFDLGGVNAGRRQQGIAQGGCAHGCVQLFAAVLEHLANKRIAVAVGAAGGQPENDAVVVDGGAVYEFVVLDCADRKAGQIVFPATVHAGHLSRFAANQCAAGLAAALGNAGDDGRRGVNVQFATREVVEKKQRLGTADQHVIDAHGHQVNAYGVVAKI